MSTVLIHPGNTVPADEQVRQLPLAEIVESKTNPRTYFDPAALNDLAASIRANGVLEPIVVRRSQANGRADLFEIVLGARRFRASKIAQRQYVPAIVRELGDEKVLEMQLIENLQREGVTALDEARGYHRLRAELKLPVEEIARQVGKSPEYIYARMKLLELSTPAVKAVVENKISAEHGVLLARLSTAEQAEGLRRSVAHSYTVRELRAWVKEKEDAAATQKRISDEITAAKAHGTKVVKIVHEVRSYYRWSSPKLPTTVLASDEWTPAGKAKCEHLALGIYLDRQLTAYEGRSATICTKPGRCPVHKVKAEASAKAKAPESAYRRQQKEAELKKHAEQTGEGRAIEAITAKVRTGLGAGKQELRLIVRALLNRLWTDHDRLICQRRGWEGAKRQYGGKDFSAPIEAYAAKASVRDLVRLGVEMAAMSSDKLLIEAARRYKVNVAGYRRKALNELKAKAKVRKALAKDKANVTRGTKAKAKKKGAK
jgi:ParB family chromosome partitioning protein